MSVFDRTNQYEYKAPYDIHEYNKEWDLCNAAWYRDKKKRQKEINHRLTMEGAPDDPCD